MSTECMSIRSMFGDALRHKDNPEVDLRAAFIEAAGNSVEMEATNPYCAFNRLSYVAARALIKIATKKI